MKDVEITMKRRREDVQETMKRRTFGLGLRSITALRCVAALVIVAMSTASLLCRYSSNNPDGKNKNNLSKIPQNSLTLMSMTEISLKK